MITVSIPYRDGPSCPFYAKPDGMRYDFLLRSPVLEWLALHGRSMVFNRIRYRKDSEGFEEWDRMEFFFRDRAEALLFKLTWA